MKQVTASFRSSMRWLTGGQRSRIANVVLSISFGVMLALLFGVTVASARPAAPDTATGYVVIQSGDQDLIARAITFTAPISGLHALELSGADVVIATYSFGKAVCSINGVGCPADNCFCGGSTFWSYKFWDGSAWQDYMVGPGDSSLNDGAVEGWRWGEWGSAMWPARPVTASLQALEWLRPQQSLTDGGYGGDSASAEALLSVGANGYAADEWRRQPDSPSLHSYWLGRAPIYSRTSAAAAGKLAIGMIATEACWPHATVSPGAFYNPTSGVYAAGAGPQAFAILGVVATGETVPANATQYLKSLVQSDGGWGWSGGLSTDTNATALALQALIAAGEPLTSPIITQGLAYLRSAQNDDGGFPYAPDPTSSPASDANSTAYVVQAIRAAGQDPNGAEWSKGSDNPISFLLSLQLPDGSFEWKQGSGSNALATYQAVVALLGRPFPLKTTPITWCPTYYLPVVSR
jgi:hypothetical protein